MSMAAFALAAEHVNTDQAHATLCGTEAVPECVGEFDAFPGDRLRLDEFPRRERAVGLPAENLTEPPIVAYFPGKCRCFGEVRPGRRRSH